MSYSIGFKKCTLNFIEQGGSKIEASHLFSVGRRTVFTWIKQNKERGTLANKESVSSPRKLQKEALKA